MASGMNSAPENTSHNQDLSNDKSDTGNTASILRQTRENLNFDDEAAQPCEAESGILHQSSNYETQVPFTMTKGNIPQLEAFQQQPVLSESSEMSQSEPCELTTDTKVSLNSNAVSSLPLENLSKNHTEQGNLDCIEDTESSNHEPNPTVIQELDTD